MMVDTGWLQQLYGLPNNNAKGKCNINNNICNPMQQEMIKWSDNFEKDPITIMYKGSNIPEEEIGFPLYT